MTATTDTSRNATTMTAPQSKLWKLAEIHLKKIGGFSAISRNADASIRERGNTEGTYEWALMKCAGLSNGCLTDDDCVRIIAILESH